MHSRMPIPKLRSRFLDAALELLEAERELDASAVQTGAARLLPGGFVLCASVCVSASPPPGEAEEAARP